MKRMVLITCLTLFTQLIHAQINAITETGDEVVLYPNGTWNYLNDSITEESTIPHNEKEFIKDQNSTFLVKSKKLNVGIGINPKKWSFSKAIDNEAAEFQFQMRNEDLYAMMITEKVSFPLPTLKNIAIDNARTVSPDIQIIKEEYRKVNGIKVFMMQMKGTIQGVSFFYYGYYYSNTNGTVQLLTYTGDNLFREYSHDMELFLNGLVQL